MFKVNFLRKVGSGIVVCAALIAVSAQAKSDPKKPVPAGRRFLMGVIGDSISAGVFARLDRPLAGFLPRSVRSLPGLVDKNNGNWASGRKIDSHFRFLLEYFDAEEENYSLRVLNVAHGGDTSSDFEWQARKIVKAMRSGKYDQLVYLALFLGSNDACSRKHKGGVPDVVMAEYLRRGFETLSEIQQDQPLRILVVGIPRIPDLGVPDIRNSRTLFGMSCHLVRDSALRFCKNLTDWQTAEEYAERLAVVANKNRVLRETVEEMRKLYPKMDIVFAEKLSNMRITRDIVSFECFHPNRRGHEIISSATWSEQPWFTTPATP